MLKPLLQIVAEKLNSDELQLPVFSPVALRAREMIAQGVYQESTLVRMIMVDQSLTCQILREANSGFFSGLRRVSTLEEALTRLGRNRVAALILTLIEQDTYISPDARINGYLLDIWRHSLTVAMASKWLAEKADYPGMANEAFLAGLLHDIGKLFLVRVLDEIVASDEINSDLSGDLIKEVLQTQHTTQGFNLLSRWNLPERYCHVVRDHHEDNFDATDVLMIMLRLVNLACQKVGVGLMHDPTIILTNTNEAHVGGFNEVMLAELEIRIERIVQLTERVRTTQSMTF
ncbi:MAG: HDOD domain-containing protein [Deltaproteobacteria bacterium]|nr:HDOD domain-containing protein [Deltaproteobacteria bacterium]